MRKKLKPIGIIGFAAGIAAGAYLAASGHSLISVGHAEDAKETAPAFPPVKALTELDACFPGTEDIKPDEMRVIASGRCVSGGRAAPRRNTEPSGLSTISATPIPGTRARGWATSIPSA